MPCPSRERASRETRSQVNINRGVVMKLTTLMACALALAGLQGCATYGSLTAVPTNGERSIYKDGRNTLTSVKLNTVAVTPNSDRVKSGDRGDFTIAVNNGTTADVVFSTEDITAQSSTGGHTASLKVYTYEELVAQEKRRQAWAAFAVAMAGAANSINAANAGYSHTYGTYSGSAYGSNGTSAHGYGSYSSTTYNPAVAQAAMNDAQANTAANFALLAEQGQAQLSNLRTTILKKETIFPGDWHGGVVEVALPTVADAPQEIRLDVNVGGEPHEFIFTLDRAQD